MLWAWLLTLPAAAIVGGLASLLTRLGLVGFLGVLVLMAAASLAILIRANRTRVSHHNAMDHEEAAPEVARSPFGPGHITPITVVDGIAWTNPGDRVSQDVRLTTAASEVWAEAHDDHWMSSLVMVTAEEDDEPEESPALSDRDQTLRMEG